MKILGLDTSTTSTGYAVIENGKVLSYGCIIPPKNYDVFDRVIFIEMQIKELIKTKEIEFIVIEELVSFRNANSTRVLAGLLYHLLIEFRKREYLVVQVRPSEWRKVCKISGKIRKEYKQNTIKHVYNVHNLQVNEDESDAICIAMYGESLEVFE